MGYGRIHSPSELGSPFALPSRMSTDALPGESTKTSPALSILIPCYNEQEGLNRMATEQAPVLQELQAIGATEVVFVDDGSADDTWQGLGRLAATGLAGTPVQVVRHDRNRGLGAALRTGFAACRGQVIVTTDSDSTYRFDEIPRLLSLLEGDVAVVTASQYHPAGRIKNVPAHRLILSRGASILYRITEEPASRDP